MAGSTSRMRRSLVASGLATVLLAGLVATAPPVAAGTKNPVIPPSPRPLVSGWMPYWTPTSSLASFEDNATLFSDVTGFWHSSTGAATIVDQLSDSSRAAIVAAVHAKGVKIIGAVTDGTGPRNMAAILNDKSKRTTHVQALVSLATTNNYDGIDLDYEGFAFSDGSATWSTTRPDWVVFVKELSAALHAKGLWLTASVPVMYDSDRDGSSGYWVYDYAGIGPYVDRLRIMTYDYSVSAPGPIAPIAWVRRVLDYATTQVAPGKIQVGVPAYGRDWPRTTAGCPVDNMPARDSYTSREALAVAAAKGKTPEWDPTYQERTFSYRKTYSGVNSAGAPVSCRITRTVWFEEKSAALRRAWLVGEYKLAGIAQWTVGGEDPRQWALIKDYARDISKVSPRVELFAGNMTYGGSVSVHATVKDGAGRPISGEEWALSWRASGSPTWKVVNRGVTSSAGTMSLPKKPRTNGYWKLWVGGSWSRFTATTVENRTLVRLRVTAAFGKTTVKRDTKIRLRGHVDPGQAGLLVERQRRVAGEWATVGTTTTRADGTYSMAVTPTEKGLYTYRVKISGAERRAAGYSTTLHLTVT